MASSSSLTVSQALVNRAIYSPTPDRLSIPSCFNLSSRTLNNKSSLTLSRSNRSSKALKSTSVVRASAVETLEKTETELVDKSVNTIRFLAIDAVEKANSGHPGLPMGCAPMGHILYDEVMRYNPKNPYWFNRDRFVLSAGHGCMLQYALLHLAGYDSVKEEDLKQFRQWGSKTPGHPENFETPGIEVTTGPLGQGICNAVGLALAEKHLAARFNKPDNEIIDHYTYCILGDGCHMEGVANEACSLAGHWGLNKLIAFYDDNHISIDGDTQIAFTENVDKRMEALGWHVIWVKNGNTGYDEIRAAIAEAKTIKDKPTMIKEEHYMSNLQFSLLQVSCVKECPANGSRVVIASYRDTYGQIQKLALRFKTSSHVGIFINSLKRVGVSKSTKQPKDLAHGKGEQPNLAVTKEAMSVSKKRKRKDLKSSLEKVSLKDAMDTSVPSSCFTSEISSESEFVSSNRLQCRGDELSFVEPVATSSPLVTSIFNYSAKQNECSQEPLLGYNSKSISEVDMPPSFTVLLSNCSGEVEQEQVYIPVKKPEEENDLKSQIKRYMADPSFHDILAKVDKVFTKMGGFLEL